MIRLRYEFVWQRKESKQKDIREYGRSTNHLVWPCGVRKGEGEWRERGEEGRGRGFREEEEGARGRGGKEERREGV